MKTNQEATNRRRVNTALASLPVYHVGLPLDQINSILEANGFNRMEPGIYCGRMGMIHEAVSDRTWLRVQWHKMEVSGRYEIVAYVS